VVSAFFVITQDFHIFPGLYRSMLLNYRNTPPRGIEVFTAVAKDGHAVEVWRLRAEGAPKRAALLFHGNAEHLTRFVQVQRWLASLGITTYSVEYRGYGGRASGWPSENGFYLDADAAAELLQKEEAIDPKEMIIFGSSIGTGTAAYAAQKYNAGTLVLLSPYSSLTELVQEVPFFGGLARFVKYRFPTGEYLKNLDDTCVVAAHGKKDSTIPFHHSERLKESYGGNSTFTLIESEEAGHNDLLVQTLDRIAREMEACAGSQNSSSSCSPDGRRLIRQP
jgi:uncharacterized protein